MFNSSSVVSLKPSEARRILQVLRGGGSLPLIKLQRLLASISPDMVVNGLTKQITAHLERAYYAWPDTWKQWTTQGKSDWLDEQVIELVTQIGMIDELKESGGEFQVKQIPDAIPIRYGINGYGNIVVADLRTLRTDRLGYFSDLGDRLGRATASRLHETIYVKFLRNNPTVRDGNSLFDETNHGNDLDPTAVGNDLSYDNLVTAFRKLDDITDQSGEPLSAESAYLIVGRYWREVAEQLMENPKKPGTYSDINTIRKRVKGVIYSRKLTNDWYLIVDPKELPGLHIDFFEGKQAPGVDPEKNDSSFQFVHPGRQRWRIFHYYGLVWKYYEAALRGSQATI